MTVQNAPPPWPHYKDSAAKGRLADWVEDQLAEAQYLLRQQHEVEGILLSEKTALLFAFETKDWGRVAEAMRRPGRTPAFLEVVADLIEMNAMTNRADLSRSKESYSDAYTHLSRRDDVVTAEDWEVIRHVLIRDYPQQATKGKGKELEWMTFWLAAVLRGVEDGKSDDELYSQRAEYIQRMLKAGKDQRRNRLSRLVHMVQTAIATAD